MIRSWPRHASRLAPALLAGLLAAACGTTPTTPTSTTPTVTAVSPASITTGGGTTITVTGTNFASDAKILVDGTALTSITVNSTTSITGTTAAHAAGSPSLTVASSGKSVAFAGAFAFVAPTGTNAPPVISEIRTIGARKNQPSTFADLNDQIALIGTVTDKETPISQLTYAWTASTGVIAGTGATVTWTAPATLAASPTTVTLQLSVTETFTEGAIAHRQTATSAVVVYAHDSSKEVMDMSEEFLQLFTKQVPVADVLHNFSQSTRCKAFYDSEYDDTVHNQATFKQQPGWILTRLPPVTLNFAGSCTLPTRAPVPGDACARVHAHWEVLPKAGGPLEITNGVDQLTAVLENNQWRLCDSSFVPDTAFPAALEHQVMFDARTRIIKR